VPSKRDLVRSESVQVQMTAEFSNKTLRTGDSTTCDFALRSIPQRRSCRLAAWPWRI